MSSQDAPSVAIVTPEGDETSAAATLDKALKLWEAESRTRAYKGNVFTVAYAPEPRDLTVPIDFPANDEKALLDRMRQELADIYAMHGVDGVKNLRACIERSYFAHVESFRRGDLSGSGNRTPFAAEPEIHQARVEVLQAGAQAAREIDVRRKAALGLIAVKAAELADRRLEEARREIVKEAQRYLALDRYNHDEDAQLAEAEQLLQSGKPARQVILRGPDVAALAGALRAIRQKFVATVGAKKAFEDRILQAKRAQGTTWVVEGVAADVLVIEYEMSKEEKARAAPNEAAAWAEALDALALTLAVKCRDYPILFRIWRGNHLPLSVEAQLGDQGTTYLQPRPVADIGVTAHATAGVAIGQLRASIWNTLTGAYKANTTFAAQIKKDNAVLWRYPPLIEEALNELRITIAEVDLRLPDPGIERQAAAARMAEEQSLNLFDKIGFGLGVLQLGLALAAVSTGGLALIIGSMVVGAATLHHDFTKLTEQDAAFMSVLNPTRALAAEPSYLWFTLCLAFTLLDAKGVGDAVKAARYTREADLAVRTLRDLAP